MDSFKNRVAIITGGAKGIGHTSAQKFRQQDATVIIWDRSESEPTSNDPGFVFMNVDVRNYEAVQNAARSAFDQFGRIDILINNAGITRDGTLAKMDAQQWQDVIDVNLTGVFNCTKSIAPFMIEARFGRIINTSSVVGMYGNFGQTNFAAAKSGVIGLTKVWARELGRKNVTVNAVAPGFIATDMMKTIPEKTLASIIERTPVGRLGSPEDIANVYLFLASDSASFINGAVISVDGGYVG